MLGEDGVKKKKRIKVKMCLRGKKKKKGRKGTILKKGGRQSLYVETGKRGLLIDWRGGGDEETRKKKNGFEMWSGWNVSYLNFFLFSSVPGSL